LGRLLVRGNGGRGWLESPGVGFLTGGLLRAAPSCVQRPLLVSYIAVLVRVLINAQIAARFGCPKKTLTIVVDQAYSPT
jgi:hypothetical protein